MRRIKFIELKSELGARKLGASLGTGAIKIAALNAKSTIFQRPDFERIKTENYLLFQGKQGCPFAHYIDGLQTLYNRMASAVRSTVDSGFFPLVLSGDHATAGATIAGLKMANREQRLGVVWIDAHADVHSPYTSDSGNMHGMPMNIALAYDNIECKKNELDDDTKAKWEAIKMTGGFSPKIEPKDVVYIALRSFEKEEEHLINHLGIKVITVGELRSQGVNNTVNAVLDYLACCDSIYVSFDIDSLDNSIVKGTGTPVADGISEGEAMLLLTGLVSEEKISCFEITEINPTLDDGNKTAELAFRIVNECVKCIEI